MISYDGLFRQMRKREISQYRLHKEFGVSKSRIYYMKHNKYVNTDLIDLLCRVLSCGVQDIISIEEKEESEA